MNYLFKTAILFSLFVGNLFAQNAQTIERKDWKFDTTDTQTSSTPTDLKYYKYFEVMPDEMNFKIFENQDLSHLAGKKLYVGYGVANKNGSNCKIFRAVDTGWDNDTTICLPWWRIEREYKSESNITAAPSFLDALKKPKPPLSISYCSQWSDGKSYPGGISTCTTYFDRNAGEDCWDNPEQEKCYVDNCGINLKNNCTYLDSAIGEKTTLESAVLDSTSTPKEKSTKVNLTTHSYECPSGPIVNDIECTNEQNVVIYPYECTPDDESTVVDDGEYVYCDEDRPVFDSTGEITSFQGTCSDGRTIECPVNKFENSTKICREPIMSIEKQSEQKSTELVRGYTEYVVDVYSGEPDTYSTNPNCLRANTIEDAREQELYVRIIGTGALDDDIYVLRHKIDGSHTKVYCNMQHAENHGSKKSYNGDVLQCIDNNGSYSFDQTVNIETTDIVTVQQNSENENATGVPFALGRNHYSSTRVEIDGIEVAPNTFPANAPYYPRNGGHLRTWDNTTSTLSILFPFAGAYELYFYNKNSEEIAKATLDIEDFKTITQTKALQMQLGKKMKLANGVEEDKSAREDMWAEWGGGVFGGKGSQTGDEVSAPNDSYVKENSATKIIVRDLLTNAITSIELAYPLPYPNRVFISKLKVYEYRKYRCYDDFEEFNILGSNSTPKYVCTNTPQWDSYSTGITSDIGDLTQWNSNELCEQNCRTVNQCSQVTENGLTGFKCTQRGGEDLGGDLSGNLFSDKNTCDASCYVQNQCTSYVDNDCNIVQELLKEPVSDYNGKTLYRKKEITYNCENTIEKQIGCAKYDVVVTQGDLDYNFSAVGYETKDFSDNFQESLTKVNMLEVGQQHIFSGWDGKCVQGLKWDFSYLGDPMTIMSYAMSAYQSMNYLTDSGVGWAKDMQTGFNDFTNSVTSTFDSSIAEVANGASGATGVASESTGFMGQLKSTIGNIKSKYEELANTVKQSDAYKAIDTAYTETTKKISELSNEVRKSIGLEVTNSGANASNLGGGAGGTSNLNIIDSSIQKAKEQFEKITNIKWDQTVEIGGTKLEVGNWLNIKNGDLIVFGVKSALIVAAPTEEDYITADKLLNGYAGIGTNDYEVSSYNQCMASLGASLPNLIAWSSDSAKDSSTQLIAPWQFPLRMTPEQLASIATVTSENFVKTNYVIGSNRTDDILIDVLAITQPAYLKATQTICMGAKVAQASAHIQHENNSNSSGGGSGMALGIAKAALSMACPPCGFAATIVMDLATNVFTKIDTCTDEEDAIQWSMKDFKTNKFLNKEMCTYTGSECDKKVSFGFGKKCVRTRKEYCCYDQITTRVFAEGIKEQLNIPLKECNSINIDDLKDISYRECRPGEIASINKCIPTSKYTEFQKVLFRQASKNITTDVGVGLVDQAIKSMAIQNK